jgi:hypothetical protein
VEVAPFFPENMLEELNVYFIERKTGQQSTAAPELASGAGQEH